MCPTKAILLLKSGGRAKFVTDRRQFFGGGELCKLPKHWTRFTWLQGNSKRRSVVILLRMAQEQKGGSKAGSFVEWAGTANLLLPHLRHLSGEACVSALIGSGMTLRPFWSVELPQERSAG